MNLRNGVKRKKWLWVRQLSSSDCSIQSRSYELAPETKLAGKTVASAVSNFGASAKAKLTNVAISGAPEDQLRAPLESLLHDLAEIGGLPTKTVNLVGETTLSHLKTRPDYAVTVSNALVGFIEVKAPGQGPIRASLLTRMTRISGTS